MYAGCPILWKSSTQKLIALSTTESEYIALSSALREVIAIIHLLEELKGKGFPINQDTPKVTCKTFEDNKSCIKIVSNHRTCPCTKHLSMRLHHFQSHVVKNTITINYINTKDQISDILTKLLPGPQFRKLRDKIMGWS